MSGFISAISTAAEAVSGIVSLAFGGTGGVVLGDVVFSGFEVPDQITWGGEQSMTVHKLLGGDRVIDNHGPDEADITWAGTFIDFDPERKAQNLDRMRIAGEPLPLVWGSHFYTVIIRSFTADTRYSQVPYRISCVVLRNEAAAGGPVDPDLTSAVSDDIGSALLSAPAAIAPAITAAQTLVVATGRLIPGSTAIAQAGGLMAAAQSSCVALRDVTGLTLGGIGSATDLASATANSGLVAQCAQANGYIGRALVNL